MNSNSCGKTSSMESIVDNSIYIYLYNYNYKKKNKNISDVGTLLCCCCYIPIIPGCIPENLRCRLGWFNAWELITSPKVRRLCLQFVFFVPASFASVLWITIWQSNMAIWTIINGVLMETSWIFQPFPVWFAGEFVTIGKHGCSIPIPWVNLPSLMLDIAWSKGFPQKMYDWSCFQRLFIWPKCILKYPKLRCPMVYSTHTHISLSRPRRHKLEQYTNTRKTHQKWGGIKPCKKSEVYGSFRPISCLALGLASLLRTWIKSPLGTSSPRPSQQ